MSASSLDFALFEQALDQYEKDISCKRTKSRKKPDTSSGSDSDSESDSQSTTETIHRGSKQCPHNDIINEDGIISCLDCGEQLQRTIKHEKEWRFYGYSDNKKSGDPNRVQVRKSDVKSIHKEIEHMGFNETIVSSANEIYNQVTKGQIFRGDSRKAVIFACVFHAYRLAGRYQMPKNMMDAFGLDKKNSLKGLKIVNINTPKTDPSHNKPITTINHIVNIMKSISANREHIIQVIQLYKDTANRSSIMNRSRPQSQASGLVYYWILENNIPIKIDAFAEIVKLSQLTIQKNMREIALIVGTNKRC